MRGPLWPPLVTLLFLSGRRTKFGSMGYFDVPSSKMALVFKFRASMTSYDVIIGNMESFVTLSFIKVEGQNLADWGILICAFQKIIYF